MLRAQNSWYFIWSIDQSQLSITLHGVLTNESSSFICRWTHFSNTIVYCHNKPERSDTAISFWNTKTGDKYQKHVKSLLSVASEGEHCVLATKNEDNISPYGLIICNSLGTPVDSKYINTEPLFVTMTSSHVFAASKEVVYVWHYRTAKSWTHLSLGLCSTSL